MKTVKGKVSKVPGVSKFGGWISNRRRVSKEKEKLAAAQETMPLKMLTFIFTFAAMGVAFSIIPLFPQPLPLMLAVLIAFVSFKSPRIGMPVGTTLIGLGLIYHLSELTFIAYLGWPTRVIFTAVWLALFIVPPIFFRRHKTAIALDLGIIAAMVLFFAPIYYLAIPIILTSAVFFRKSAATTILYYVLISLPLQVVQYFKNIMLITQTEWWIVPGSSPPVIIPLNGLTAGLQSSMTQFRLFDTSQFVNVVYTELFVNYPDVVGKTMRSAFTQYLDSFPGILLFIIMIAGIVLAFVFFAKVFIKEANLSYGDQLLAPITAIVTTALFFILLNVLQKPLAFNANVDAATILIATTATALFTVPVSLLTSKPKITATGEMIIAKVNELKAELKEFESTLNKVKASIPVNVASPEGKMVILNDKLDDILRKATSSFFAESADLDRIYEDLNKNTSQEIKNLSDELNQILGEYQILVNGEYADWSGKLKHAGLKINGGIKPPAQKDMPLEQRIESIQTVLLESRNMANDVIATAEPVYNIIRALYDPNLPEECQVVVFAREKLHNQAPFHAVSGLFSGLVNWQKQYGKQVEESIEQLNKSLTNITELGKNPETLAVIVGDKLPSVLSDIKRAEAIKKASEKTQPNVLNILTLMEMLDSFIYISKDVLSILYEEVKDKEQTIDDLTPAEDTFWAKNATLRERMTFAIQELYNPKTRLSQIMEHLPKYLDYIQEAVQTIAAYNDRKELLLNYPMAEAAILEQLKIKTKLSPQDLPFQQKYAAEYLRLFYMQRFSQYSFDYQNAWLTKKN